ncbi:hypothetical protein CapIbe_000887 [Capra ibex]
MADPPSGGALGRHGPGKWGGGGGKRGGGGTAAGAGAANLASRPRRGPGVTGAPPPPGTLPGETRALRASRKWWFLLPPSALPALPEFGDPTNGRFGDKSI